MRIENTSDRQYDLSAKGFDTVAVPAATKDEKGVKTNGSAEVSAEMLKAVKADAWGTAVFASGDLVEAASKAPAKKDEEPKAPSK